MADTVVEAPSALGERPSVTRRAASSGASILVQMVSFQGTTFLANIVLARWFGPAGFGAFSAGLQTLNSASQTAQLATAAVGSRYLGYWYDHDRNRALRGWNECRRIGIRSAVVFTIACVALAWPMANRLFAMPRAVTELAVAGAGVYFVVASQQLLQAFIALEKSRTIIVASIATGIGYLLLTLIGGRMLGPAGALAGVGVSYVLLLLLLTPTAKRELIVLTSAPVPTENEEKLLRDQLLPASISGFLLLPSSWLLLASVSLHGGPAQAGLFSAATQIRLLLMTVPQVVNSVGIVLINRLAQGEQAAYVKKLSAYGLLGSSSLTTALGLVTAQLLPILFGARYAAGVPILRVLAVSVVLESALLLVRQRLQVNALYKDWLLFATLPWQLGTLGCAALLVPRYGGLGAAISYVTGLGVGLLSATVLWRLKPTNTDSTR